MREDEQRFLDKWDLQEIMKKLVSRDPILSSFFGSDHSNSESDSIFN